MQSRVQTQPELALHLLALRNSATTGKAWDSRSYLPHMRVRAAGGVAGTVLMQLVGKRSLRVETFPGKQAAQVSGFDSGALMYER